MLKHLICFGLMLGLLAVGCDDVIKSSWPQYAVKSKGYYGFINDHGEMEVSPQFSYAMDFSEGYAGVNVGGLAKGKDIPEDGKWGFVDSTGKYVINPMYDSPPNGIMPFDIQRLHLVMHEGYIFSQGLAAVMKEGKWKYINKKNETIIDAALIREVIDQDNFNAKMTIRSARKFSEGLAAVYIDGAWGYINLSGFVVIKPTYLFPVDFQDGRAVVMKEDRTTICIDKQGKQVLSEYLFESSYHHGYATARKYFLGEKTKDSDKYEVGLIDLTGRFMVGPYYDEVGPYDYQTRYCPVRMGSNKKSDPVFSDKIKTMDLEGGKWGFSDLTDTIRIAPIYESAKGFANGLAPVKLNNQWGYINRSGGWAFQPRFQYAGPFRGALALVKLSRTHDTYANKFAYIDLEGNVVWIAE